MSSLKERHESVFNAKSQAELQAAYDKWASQYDEDLSVLGGGSNVAGLSTSQVLLRYADPKTHPRLIDVGCGTGAAAPTLHAKGWRDFVGLDLSPGMLEKAGERKHDGKCIYGELLNKAMPESGLQDDSFDVLHAAAIFAPGQAPASSFDEFVRIVRPGGLLVFSIRQHYYDSDEGSAHKEAIEKLVSDGKVKIIEQTLQPYLPKEGIEAYVFVLELKAEPSLVGEYSNIALLLLLYTMQSIPMGLFGYVNMQVKELFKGEFSQQGTFMLAAWPFSLKLFWAPVVDTWFFESFGRRKTWMVPSQLAIGALLLYLSTGLEALLAAKAINLLTTVFFVLYLLCATQDIAVDGWALTMLREENAGYASTCNAIGQNFGFSLGFFIPMSGYVPVSLFLSFWGVFFIIATIIVAIFKAEAADEQIESLKEAYLTMYRIARQPCMGKLVLHLFTRGLPFIPADVLAPGRLQDSGFPKETLASIKLVTIPVETLVASAVSKFTAGDKPMDVVLAAFLPRAMITSLIALFAFYVGDIGQSIPWWMTSAVAMFVVAQALFSQSMFVAHMAFFAKVSDPRIGGTYMTFLNTIHNLGNMWASTFCLKAADWVKHYTGFDGFYAVSLACTLNIVRDMQGLPMSEWRVPEDHDKAE